MRTAAWKMILPTLRERAKQHQYTISSNKRQAREETPTTLTTKLYHYNLRNRVK